MADAKSQDEPVDESPRSAQMRALRMLWPYLGRYRGRLLLILGILLISKFANLGVPVSFKQIVDALDPTLAMLTVPAAMLLAYGALRIIAAVFGEARGVLFSVISGRARREAALDAFNHLHRLSMRFHLARQTGGISRAIEKGTSSIEDFLYYVMIMIVPTLAEISMGLALLGFAYDWRFVAITMCALTVYVWVTIRITEWRTEFYRTANRIDQEANARAVDSLLNYETVKYFNNERFEANRYDERLADYEYASRKSWLSLSLLNSAQQITIAVALTAMMWLAASEVAVGRMSVGDLVLVSTLLVQLFMPLGFLGMMYRDIRQALTDMERMFGLFDQPVEVADVADAKPLTLRGATLVFDHVNFSYDGVRPILQDVSFRIEAGQKVAVVGPSGSGKSTLARLLYRFYDVTGGQILIDGQDVRSVSQDSLRAAIGIVPQDTVLFNDTLRYNVAYGRTQAGPDALDQVIRTAQLDRLIELLPDGLETQVGERGLKLSGGEKQRVALARALLKDPAIMVFDEATSALDSATEQAIQAQLDQVASARTSLVIAHRLSTIVDADWIVVLDQGKVREQGRHRELLQQQGLYARLWSMQQE